MNASFALGVLGSVACAVEVARAVCSPGVVGFSAFGVCVERERGLGRTFGFSSRQRRERGLCDQLRTAPLDEGTAKGSIDSPHRLRLVRGSKLRLESLFPLVRGGPLLPL